MARIHLVGGEKGGVGKSVLSRVLAQYHIDNDIPFKAFDGDLSHGALMRYYADFTEEVDMRRFESADRVMETVVESGHEVLVDLPPQASSVVDRWIAEAGLIEFSKEVGVRLTLWHVMDDGPESIRLLQKEIDNHGYGPDYVLVRNHGRGTDFSRFNQSEAKTMAESLGACIMDLPGLYPASMRKIDHFGASFWAAGNNKDSSTGQVLGLIDRQRVRIWLKKSYAELDRILQEK